MVAIPTGTAIVALFMLLWAEEISKVQGQADKDSGMVIH
jgi:hypothetical protein